jgi:hypothetical protein
MFSNPVSSDVESYDMRKEVAFSQFRNYKTRFINELADKFLAYLWYASWGEARNAHGHCAGSVPDCISQGVSRNSSALESMAFNPEHNWKQLVQVFYDNSWDSAFGGDAWGKIIDSFEYYYRFPDMRGIFVDLVVDLEHNGGDLFDKYDAGVRAGLDFDIYRSDLHTLLNHKKDYSMFFDKNDHILAISHETQDICRDVMYACGLHPQYVAYNEVWESLTGFEPRWGTDLIENYSWEEVSSQYCESCGESVSEDEVYVSESGSVYCEYCYHRKYTHCYRCGEEVYIEDVAEVNGYGYCQYCAERIAIQCWDCNNWVDRDDAIEVDGTAYCEDCADHLFEKCNDCGNYFDDEESGKQVSGNWYCDDCIPSCEQCKEQKDTISWCTLPNLVTGGKMLCDDCKAELESRGYNEGQLPLFDLYTLEVVK